MSDTQRLDWLERDPDRLIFRTDLDGAPKFRAAIEIKRGLTTTYSPEYDTLRDAIDEGMKHTL